MIIIIVEKNVQKWSRFCKVVDTLVYNFAKHWFELTTIMYFFAT